MTEWTKAALLELQEYLRLVAATTRALFSRPYYYRDIVEQFMAIGMGSMTVVLLTGTFTGAPMDAVFPVGLASPWSLNSISKAIKEGSASIRITSKRSSRSRGEVFTRSS